MIEKERDWEEWWLRKSNSRIVKLEVEDRILNEPLFYEEDSPDELAMWLSVRGVGCFLKDLRLTRLQNKKQSKHVISIQREMIPP